MIEVSLVFKISLNEFDCEIHTANDGWVATIEAKCDLIDLTNRCLALGRLR